MTTDIKERLRVKAARMEAIDFVICAKLYQDAADYIEQLEGQTAEPVAAHKFPDMVMSQAGLEVAKRLDYYVNTRCDVDAIYMAMVNTHPAKTEQPSLSDAQLEEIASWLDEASDDIDSWGGYASDYFADKWNLAGAIKSYKDRAAKVRALLSAQRQDREQSRLMLADDTSPRIPQRQDSNKDAAPVKAPAKRCGTCRHSDLAPDGACQTCFSDPTSMDNKLLNWEPIIANGAPK